MRNASLSGHQSAKMKNDEWLTPPEILKPLGDFDLDPCSPINRPWTTASKHLTKLDDGLSKGWFGRVWLNPPFGQNREWIRMMEAHGNGIMLLAARTETQNWFDYIWNCASAICFIRGRPHFHYVDGTRAAFNSGAPICLVAYDTKFKHPLNSSVLLNSKLGRTILL